MTHAEIDALIKRANGAFGRTISESSELARQALEASNEAGYRRGVLRSKFLLAYAESRGHSTGYAKVFSDLAEEFLSIEDWDSAARSRIHEAAELLKQGQSKEAISTLERAIAFTTEHNLPERLATALSNLGHVYLEQQRYPEALEILEQAISVYESAGITAEMAYSNLAGVYYSMKQFDKCELYLQKSLEVAESKGYTKSMVVALGNLGILAGEQGEHEKAVEYQTRALKIAERREDLEAATQILAILPSNFIALGRYTEAEMTIQKLLAYVGSTGNAETVAKAYQAKAELHLARGNPKRAIEELKTAQGYAYQTHVLSLQQEIAALLEKAQGQVAGARPGA